MKSSPDDLAALSVAHDSQRMADWLKGLARGVQQDMEDRSSWVQAREHYFSRRYCLEWRNPTHPWVGSSNVVLPFIDKKIDELKPQYVNLVAAAKPPVTAKAILPQYQKKTRSVELWFDFMVHHGSPNFVSETVLGVDDCLETGRCIIKDYWRYETRQTPTVLKASRLPPELRRLIVTQGDDKRANELFIAGGGPGGAVVLTRRQFDEMRQQINLVVQKAFDLDPDEPRDKKAIAEVMAWFRGGAKGELKFESRDVLINCPAILAINPIDFIVPENATSEIEDLERFAEVMYFTEQQLRAAAIDQKLETKAVDALIDRRNRASSGKGGAGSNWQRQLMDLRQGMNEGIVDSSKDGLFEIWKVSTRLATEEGGADKKVTVLLPVEAPDLPLKFKLHSRASGLWGYHSYTFEHNKRRWYAPRGIPEKIDDIDAEINAQHRAKLNRAAIANAPTFKAKPNRNYNVNNWRWTPGGVYFTSDPVNDLIEMRVANLDMSFDSEIQTLRVWGESYLGGPDYGLTDNSSLTESRTATEINAIQGQARQSLSMRGMLFQNCYQGIYREFFNQEMELGPPERFITVTGEEEPIRLLKEELQGQYLIQCTGTIGNSDPVVEAQKAQNRIILLAQLKPLLGLQWEMNLGEAVLDWMEKDDIRLMRRVLRQRSPEEVQKIQQQMEQQAAQQEQQELAMAQAGGKTSKPAAGKSQGGGVSNLPPLGVR